MTFAPLAALLERPRLLWGILALSLLLKLGLLLYLGPQPFLDGKWYAQAARETAANGFLFPDRFLKDAPGTPWFFSLFAWLEPHLGLYGYALANVLAATATVAVLYFLALELFGCRKAAALAGAGAAAYPFFNFYAIALLSETLYLFLLYLALWFAVRSVRTGAGRDLGFFALFFGLDTLVRFANLAMFPPLLGLLLFLHFRKNRAWKRTLAAGAGAAALFCLVMLPWWIRNYQLHGEVVLTGVGESGKIFYSGNNPMNKTGGGIGGVDVDLSPFDHIQDPAEKDRAMKEAALRWIKENPGAWLTLEVRKLVRLYRFTLYDPRYRAWHYKLLSIASYGAVFVLFFVGLYRHRELFWRYSPMLLYALLLTGLHLVFIASVRYRLPVEPFMVVMAAGAAAGFLRSRSGVTTG